MALATQKRRFPVPAAQASSARWQKQLRAPGSSMRHDDDTPKAREVPDPTQHAPLFGEGAPGKRSPAWDWRMVLVPQPQGAQQGRPQENLGNLLREAEPEFSHPHVI